MKPSQVMSLPLMSWFLFFLAIPLVFVVCLSLLQMSSYGELIWSFGHGQYLKVFSEQNFRILLHSLRLASLTTVFCFIFGVPISWALATEGSSRRIFFLILLSLPFLSNLVIRLYAIRVFVGFDGPLQFLLRSLNIAFDPFYLTQNQFLVIFAMVTTYLPFFVFPLYSAFEKFDFLQVEAAQDLGASSVRILNQIIIPRLKKPIMSGSILVFIPALGEYLIPDLMGGAKTMLLGNLITHEFLKARDWPMGAALSVVMMMFLVIFYFIYHLFSGLRRD